VALGSLHVDPSNVHPQLSFYASSALLNGHEEEQLSASVRELAHWTSIREQLAAQLSRAPTHGEWSREVGFSGSDLHFHDTLLAMHGARDKLITSNLRLVQYIAKNYSGKGLHMQDLVQEGTLGLITAAEKYDARGRFATYAAYWIRMRIRRAVGTTAQPIRLPVRVSDSISEIKRARYGFLRDHGRFPTDPELSKLVGCSEAKLRLVLDASRGHLSLEAPLSSVDGLGGPSSRLSSLAELIADDSSSQPEALLGAQDVRDQLCVAIARVLDPYECRVIRLLYALDGGGRRVHADVAVSLGSTRERVREIEINSLRKLRSNRQLRPLLSAHLESID